MRHCYRLGIGLSAIVLANLAWAQAAPTSSRLRPSAQSLPNPGMTLQSSSQMSMLALQSQVSRRSQQVHMTGNVMGGLDNAQKAVAQNIGGGGGTPGGVSNRNGVSNRSGASNRSVVSGTVACPQCRAPAKRVPAALSRPSR